MGCCYQPDHIGFKANFEVYEIPNYNNNKKVEICKQISALVGCSSKNVEDSSFEGNCC